VLQDALGHCQCCCNQHRLAELQLPSPILLYAFEAIDVVGAAVDAASAAMEVTNDAAQQFISPVQC
jgi:hypothetical protein